MSWSILSLNKWGSERGVFNFFNGRQWQSQDLIRGGNLHTNTRALEYIYILVANLCDAQENY